MKKMTLALTALTLTLTACSKESANYSTGASANDSGIVGGQLTDSADPLNKSTVQILTVSSEGLAGCTGTILTDQVILSAAHCTTENPGRIFVYFSSQKLTPEQTLAILRAGKQTALFRQVRGGLVSDDWEKLTSAKQTDWGDISLLKIAGGLPDGYVPARLPSRQIQLASNQVVTLAGFGITDGMTHQATTGLRRVDVRIVNAELSPQEILLETGNGKGACHGDSGGPAYLNIGGVNYVVGITSRADHATDPQGLCIGRTVYTKVSAFSDFIERGIQTLQDASFKPEPIPQPRAEEPQPQSVPGSDT